MPDTREIQKIMQLQYLAGFEKFSKRTIAEELERQKLIELLADSEYMSFEKKADYLIANGATIPARWTGSQDLARRSTGLGRKRVLWMDDCRKQITALIQNFADSTIFCGGTIVAGTKVDFVVNHLLANNVVVQKQGRWIPLDWDENRNEEALAADEYECSECGEYITFGEITEKEDLPKFCACCGTKMGSGA